MRPRSLAGIAFISALILVAVAVGVPSSTVKAKENFPANTWSVSFFAGDRLLGWHDFITKPKLVFDKNKCIVMPTKEEYCNATVSMKKIKRP
jgi:hypothetical protein